MSWCLYFVPFEFCPQRSFPRAELCPGKVLLTGHRVRPAPSDFARVAWQPLGIGIYRPGPCRASVGFVLLCRLVRTHSHVRYPVRCGSTFSLWFQTQVAIPHRFSRCWWLMFTCSHFGVVERLVTLFCYQCCLWAWGQIAYLLWASTSFLWNGLIHKIRCCKKCLPCGTHFINVISL